MTFVFSFPIKDAWVFAADKLETEALFRRGDTIHIPVATVEKIALSENFVITGCGREDIISTASRFIEENNFATMEELKEALIELFRSNYLFEGTLNTTLLVFHRLDWQIAEFDLDTVRSAGTRGINETNGPHALSPQRYVRTATLTSVAEQFAEFDFTIDMQEALEDQRVLSTSNALVDSCIQQLAHVASDDLRIVGHPAIHGMDIFIVRRTGASRVFVYPRKYEIEAKND